MAAVQDANAAYGKIVKLAQAAGIDEAGVRRAGLTYWNEAVVPFNAAQSDPARIPALLQAIDGIAEKLTKALGATPAMEELTAAIGGFPDELTDIFGVFVDLAAVAPATNRP